MAINGINGHWRGRGPIDSSHVVTNVPFGITTDAIHVLLLSNGGWFYKNWSPFLAWTWVVLANFTAPTLLTGKQTILVIVWIERLSKRDAAMQTFSIFGTVGVGVAFGNTK